MTLNPISMNLPPYPMEALAKIRTDLHTKGVNVYDFGTGDPKIPTWPPIREAMASSIPEISQYPSVAGSRKLARKYMVLLPSSFFISGRICP